MVKRRTTQESVVTDEELAPLSETDFRRLEKSGVLREVLLYEKLPGDRVKCAICQRRCSIAEGRAGYCRTKVNRGGTLYTTIYGVISSANADPIEKKPVFHYKPGSVVFSIGSFGCNFRCLFCQNWQIAYADAVAGAEPCETHVPPEQIVQMAIDSGSQGLAWTYNEPGIWLNYTLDTAKPAKAAGLYTVYVTNGYATPEHLDMIGPYLDVYRVDLKSFDDQFYRKLIKVPHVQGILDVAKRAKDKWNMHVEVVTNIVPTWNDDEDNMRKIARWISQELGELTPWHVTRFFPYAQLTNVPPTPPATLERAVAIGHEEGLKFVYLGNVASRTGMNTYCPTDGKLVIARNGYNVDLVAVTPEGKCAYDGSDLNLVM
jgi:pyruvate formate lyase activating enzyme